MYGMCMSRGGPEAQTQRQRTSRAVYRHACGHAAWRTTCLFAERSTELARRCVPEMRAGEGKCANGTTYKLASEARRTRSRLRATNYSGYMVRRRRAARWNVPSNKRDGSKPRRYSCDGAGGRLDRDTTRSIQPRPARRGAATGADQHWNNLRVGPFRTCP